MRTSLPAKFRALKVHEESFESNLSSSDLQDTYLIAESERGAPRYLEGRWEIVNPSTRAMFLCVEGGVLKKKSWDFAALMEVPEASEKRDRSELKAEASFTEGCPKSKVSSTNR